MKLFLCLLFGLVWFGCDEHWMCEVKVGLFLVFYLLWCLFCLFIVHLLFGNLIGSRSSVQVEISLKPVFQDGSNKLLLHEKNM